MEKIKGFVNKNYKVVISFILGMIVCIGIGVSAVATKDIVYDNSTSGLTSTNLQGAIDELNTKATTKIKEAKKECPEGYNCSKICNVTNGTGLNVGDEINCNGDDFYVIETSDNSISMLTKYPVLTDGSGQSSDCIRANLDDISQSPNAENCTYGGTNGYLDTYKNRLFENNEDISIQHDITVSQLNNLGCSITIEKVPYYQGTIDIPAGTCVDSGKDWLYSFIYSVEDFITNPLNAYMKTDGAVSNVAMDVPIRPVVKIPRSYV